MEGGKKNCNIRKRGIGSLISQKKMIVNGKRNRGDGGNGWISRYFNDHRRTNQLCEFLSENHRVLPKLLKQLQFQSIKKVENWYVGRKVACELLFILF